MSTKTTKPQKIITPQPVIYEARVRLAENGWVIETNGGSSEDFRGLRGHTFIANSPAEIGRIFERFSAKPSVKRKA